MLMGQKSYEDVMDVVELKKELLKQVINNSRISIDDSIKYDTYLRDLGIDSIIIVDIIVAIEETYEFEFDSEELNLDNFRSIDTIAELVCKKING